MRKILTAVGATLAATALTLTGGTTALAAGPAAIHVPDDFVQALSDARTTGKYEVQGTGLRVWTTGATSTDKVAEYVATSTPLAAVGEPKLNYDPTSGTTPPGFQLVVDFGEDGSADGILVGEPIYNGNWWLNDAAEPFIKGGAPIVGGGSGSIWNGTLENGRRRFRTPPSWPLASCSARVSWAMASSSRSSSPAPSTPSRSRQSR